MSKSIRVSIYARPETTKPDATAFNGLKKGTIAGKGAINNVMSNHMFQLLEQQGVPTHFVEQLNDRDQLCRRVKIFPMEVIVRNIIAGSMAKRLDIPEGTQPANTIIDLCYKKDELGDPLINNDHVVALGIASYEELDEILDMTRRINVLLTDLFKVLGIKLVDFKLEFGKTSDGKIVLADEISPDTSRLWDAETNEKLDKDRFRRDLGKVHEAYEEILRRLTK